MKFIKVLLITLAIVLIIKVFAFTSCTIPFSGMENSLYQGERVIVNKWSYGFRTPLMWLFSYHRILEKPVSKNDIVVFNNPFPEKRNKSISSQEVYISRCIGLPGDTIMLDKNLTLTHQTIFSPDYKSLYSYPKNKEDLLLKAMKVFNIDNNELISYYEDQFIRSFSHYEIYLLKQKIGKLIPFKSLQIGNDDTIHPFVIPAKDTPLQIYPWNAELIANTILLHEGKEVAIENDTLIIDNRKVTSYTFTKDYYWMVSNNSVNFNDSRLFGLVPKDHVIGKASFIWFSKDRNAGLFEGFRWNRFFTSVQ